MDIKNEAYAKLLTKLLSHCETVQCVMTEDDEAYFEPILNALLEKRYVTQWPLTQLGSGAAPVLQYTFEYNFQTAEFLKECQSSLFSWLMPHPEDWSFWQGETCLLATCSHEQMMDMVPEVEALLELK
ncbi:MAG: hypothetical protein ABS882_00440 [Lysinibacillus sp.]